MVDDQSNSGLARPSRIGFMNVVSVQDLRNYLKSQKLKIKNKNHILRSPTAQFWRHPSLRFQSPIGEDLAKGARHVISRRCQSSSRKFPR
jgi:hypothetical protein